MVELSDRLTRGDCLRMRSRLSSPTLAPYDMVFLVPAPELVQVAREIVGQEPRVEVIAGCRNTKRQYRRWRQEAQAHG